MFNYMDITLAKAEADARQLRQMEIASRGIKKVQDAIAKAQAENWQREQLHGQLVAEMLPTMPQRAAQALIALLTGKSANRRQPPAYMGHGAVTK